MTSETFEMPADFNTETLLQNSVGMMTGTGDYDVVIEMDAWLTDLWRDRRWHPSQQWRVLPGGGSLLRLRLGCLEEIEQWVLSWGTHANVMCPQELVGRVLRTATELKARYEKAMDNGSAPAAN